MYAGKPIIGIVGGIGSGKSLVARLFGEMGCCVINSDEMVRQAYKDAMVKQQLRKWWGGLIFDPTGEIDRSAVWRKVMDRPTERRRLEQFIHPIVNETRERLMRSRADDPQVVAFVWDTPLLVETGLHEHCDAVVFVEAPADLRQQRVSAARGWSAAELAERENLQMPLDRKGKISDHVIVNTADEDYARGQVREVLSRILAETSPRPLSSS
jgi:dephospho-CoA kinase